MYSSPCGYFSDRKSQMTVYSFPTETEVAALLSSASKPGYDNKLPDNQTFQQFFYSQMLEQGFRRSNDIIYRNDCPQCKQCIPIRIDVTRFTPDKSQRHLLKKNSDITLTITDTARAFITAEKQLLYRQYYKWHNPDTTCTNIQAEVELKMLNGLDETSQNPIYNGTINMEYRLNGSLIGCGVIDLAANALSSNYFYWDISKPIQKRSIGTYSILKEIEFCQQNNRRWYYLGYYIAQCDAMKYKGNFKPHQLCIDNIWQEVRA